MFHLGGNYGFFSGILMSDKYPPLGSNVWIKLEVSFRERCLKRLALVLNVGLCIRTKKVTSEHAKSTFLDMFGVLKCFSQEMVFFYWRESRRSQNLRAVLF